MTISTEIELNLFTIVEVCPTDIDGRIIRLDGHGMEAEMDLLPDAARALARQLATVTTDCRLPMSWLMPADTGPADSYLGTMTLTVDLTVDQAHQLAAALA